MKNEADFKIRSKTLVKYHGSGGDVVIPQEVTSIGDWAFSECSSLTTISIPDSVTSIGESAFSNCRSLTTISIPDSVTSIGESAFSNCRSLTTISIPDSVTSIGRLAFSGCSNLTSITIPDSVTSIGGGVFNGTAAYHNSANWDNGLLYIGNHILGRKTGFDPHDYVIKDGTYSIHGNAFRFCKHLTRITIPESVTIIGSSVFRHCGSLTSVTIPEGVVHIGSMAFADSGITDLLLQCPNAKFATDAFSDCNVKNVVFEYCPTKDSSVPVLPEGTTFVLPPDCLRKKEALSVKLVRGKYPISVEDYAYLAVFQTKQSWRKLCLSSGVVGEMLPIITRILENEVTKLPLSCAKFLLSLLKDQLRKAEPAVLDATLAALQKRAPKSVQDEIAALQDEHRKPMHPVELLVEKNLQGRTFSQKILQKIKKGIPFRDGSGDCSVTALLLLISEYEAIWSKHATSESGDMGQVEMLQDGAKLRPSVLADQIAAALDPNALIQFLSELAYGNFYRKYILAYARFADEAAAEQLSKDIVKKKHGRAKERYWAANAEQALYLSETTAAVWHFERYGGLDRYAAMYHTTPDELRNNRLYNFGIDENGKKLYDLGSKTLAVILNRDLTLRLYDEAAGKFVKSVPKKGADEERYTAVKADLATLKKSIRTLQKLQFSQLFKRFLSGTGQNAKTWNDTYCKNPVIRTIASLIVWEQNKKTFTLKDGHPIDSREQPYTIGSGPIVVAHPMEMEKDDIAAWQRYFSDNKLKQPFAQVWEPVIDFETVRKDQYSGIELPLYHFSGQEKHGIYFYYDYDNSDWDICFDDCSLDCKNKTAFDRHSMDLHGTIELGDFKAKKSRASNHIIGFLDKWTIYERILKDDVTIVDRLSQFTLAQITEFIQVASENNCTNCTAALLDFKNANFSNFDPMEEFILD